MFRTVLALIFSLFLLGCETFTHEEICEFTYQDCVEPLSQGVDQWTYIQLSVQCEVDYRACINHREPVKLTCSDILAVCEDDAQYAASWLGYVVRIAECNHGYDKCVENEN